VRVEYVHFPLHPETPPEGRRLADVFGGGAQAEARIAASHRRLEALAKAEGLPYGNRTMTYNSRLAQELGAWAETQGRGEAFHDAVFRAYFAEAKDISNVAVLIDLAAAAGLDRAAAAEVLEKRTFRKAIDDDWARSFRDGIDSVPTFAAGGHVLVGAQPYPELEALVKAAGARRRRG